MTACSLCREREAVQVVDVSGVLADVCYECFLRGGGDA